MKTLVVSDLHLGARSGIDLLRARADVRDALIAGLEGVERLVLLGDVIELREGPAVEAMAQARPVLEELGTHLGDREVVIVPGNHDHRLASPWLERLAVEGAEMGLEQRVPAAQASDTAEAVASWLAPARVEVAYPGLWLSDGVYATHGHYLDRHSTVPSFEVLGLRTIERLQARRHALPAGVAGYEAVARPVFGLLHELVQTAPPPRRRDEVAGASGRMYRLLTGEQRGWRDRALSDVGFPAAVSALNSLGLGPVKADISGAELRDAGLRSLGAVVDGLGIEAEHVIFGHTHRAGPLPGDELAVWQAPSGTRLNNCGSWVIERFLGGPMPQKSAYAAGGGIYVEDGELRLTRLWREAEPATPPA